MSESEIPAGILSGRPIYDYGSYSTWTRAQLERLLQLAEKHEDLVRLCVEVRTGVNDTEQPSETEVMIVGSKVIDSLWQLMMEIMARHPEHRRVSDWESYDDKDAWGIDDSPWGYAVEEGEYALVQAYLSWKEQYNGKATYEQYKGYIMEVRNKRYSREKPSD